MASPSSSSVLSGHFHFEYLYMFHMFSLFLATLAVSIGKSATTIRWSDPAWVTLSLYIATLDWACIAICFVTMILSNSLLVWCVTALVTILAFGNLDLIRSWYFISLMHCITVESASMLPLSFDAPILSVSRYSLSAALKSPTIMDGALEFFVAKFNFCLDTHFRSLAVSSTLLFAEFNRCAAMIWILL